MLAAIVAAIAMAGPPAERIDSPAAAVRLALADSLVVQPAYRPFTRYVWVPPWIPDKEAPAPVVAYTLNLAVSRAERIVTPVAINGRLVRVDLWKLAPGDAALAALVTRWEAFAATEPYFLVRAKPGAVPAFGGHVDLAMAVQLQAHTKSAVPIVRADWFHAKTLTTTNGGLYYAFMGIERRPKAGTAQDAFLTGLGVFEGTSRRLNGVLSVAMFRSEVTAKQRRVDLFRGLGGRNGTGLVTITHDVVTGTSDPAKDPILSLVEFQDDAREVIVERNNGLPAFALFDGKGALQDSVPDTIASDHLIPAPHPKVLEPAISCIRCHAPGDGLQPLQNDIRQIARRFRAFDDRASRVSQLETADQLEARYEGDVQTVLFRGRDDYAKAVSSATGGMKPKELAEALSATFARYSYETVGPRQAMAEVGLSFPDDETAAAWMDAEMPVVDAIEDPRIGGLKTGARLPRHVWEAVFADAALRATIATADKKAN